MGEEEVERREVIKLILNHAKCYGNGKDFRAPKLIVYGNAEGKVIDGSGSGTYAREREKTISAPPYGLRKYGKENGDGGSREWER